MVWPPAGRDSRFTGFRGSGDLEKFRGPVRGLERAKNGKKWTLPVLGAVLGETPADQICLRAKCRPREPCLGSHVSPGSEIRALWGAGWGPFHRLGTGSVCPEPNRKKPFRPQPGATGEFSGMFWLIATAFALRNFLTLTMLGGFTRVFRENRDLLGFGGVKILFFVAVSKNVFSSKTERFFFVFGPWCPL